jgi:mono/diheme cytochrome c family protein
MPNRFPCMTRCLVLLAGLCLFSQATHSAEAPDYNGAQLYQVFCASCHGAKARGNGPAARSLRIKPPDLTRIARRHGGAFPVDSIIRSIDGRDLRTAHGEPGMPVWGQEFYGMDSEDPARRERSRELIEKLVTHLQSIQR